LRAASGPKSKPGKPEKPPGYMFAKSELHKYPVRLDVEFTEPITAQKAREEIRKLLDRLKLEMVGEAASDKIIEAKFTCRELGRTLKVEPRQAKRDEP
jgi:hypothetical protein